MLTNRGRWLIFFAGSGTALGLLRSQQGLALLSLSVLVWVFIECMLFRWRVEFLVRRLRCERLVNDTASAAGTLWAGRTIRIQTIVSAGPRIPIPFVRFEDHLPDNCECIDGEASIDAVVFNRPTELNYKARARGAGTVVLPGVRASIADLHGLFFARRFLPCRQTFRVMPQCSDVDISQPITKRMNAMPPPGIHRLQQAGMGSELLELREYVPGDPPKSIAWKISARKDCLMTRQYESEIPVRTILFVDVSPGAQAGSFGQRPVDRTVHAAASIARAAMAVRDPVGLVIFDETARSVIRPGAGDRHFYRMLGAMSDACVVRKRSETTYSTPLFEHAFSTIETLHPELVADRVNHPPFTIFPILPPTRKRHKRRSRLATALAQMYHLGGDAPIRLAHDDRLMAVWMNRFLDDSGFARPDRVYDHFGRRHLSERKLTVLADSMTNTVGHARDNELYVVLADLIDFATQPELLRGAIRIARTRHHRVVVICPWQDRQRKKIDPGQPLNPHNVENLVQHAEALRMDAAADRLKREMSRLRVPVAFAADRSAMQLVMAEAELARTGRTSPVRTR